MQSSSISGLSALRPIAEDAALKRTATGDFAALMGRFMGSDRSRLISQVTDLALANSASRLGGTGSATPGSSPSLALRRWFAARSAAGLNGAPAATASAHPANSSPSTGPALGGPGDYQDLILASARRHGVDPALVKAVVAAESSFDAAALSPVGAQGLMQLMPETAADLGVSDPFDPAQNIDGGTRYLRMMLERFDGDEKKALAAYNWGPGNVERGGRYPSETRNYLTKVAAFKESFSTSLSVSA